MLSIPPSCVPRTHEDDVVVVSMEDRSCIQNLSGAEKTQLLSEVTFHTYQNASLFSLATAGRWDVVVVGNPSKEKDTWKEKYEALEHKYSTFQKELADLQGKVKLVLAL